jgi:hypothetical protein
MKHKILRVNKGIVLLLVLIIVIVTISILDTAKYAARKDLAMQKAETFVTELAGLYTWPKDMPDVDAAEFEKKADKYISYFDEGYSKVKPHVYDSKFLKKELTERAMSSVRSFLLDDVKPKQVTFTPEFKKPKLNKETAEIRGTVTSKTIDKNGKTFNRSSDFILHMEYINEEWVVVEFLLNSDMF